MFRACNVASCRSKALCECAHKDVNVRRVKAIVVNNSSTMGSDGSNRMRFIQIEVCSILLLDGNNLWKFDKGALLKLEKLIPANVPMTWQDIHH